MSDQEKQLTEDELNRASGGGLVPIFHGQAPRRFGRPNPPRVKVTSLQDHREISPEQREEMDPTPQP